MLFQTQIMFNTYDIHIRTCVVCTAQ